MISMFKIDKISDSTYSVKIKLADGITIDRTVTKKDLKQLHSDLGTLLERKTVPVVEE